MIPKKGGGEERERAQLSLFALDHYPAASRPERQYVIDHFGELVGDSEPAPDTNVSRGKIVAFVQALFSVDKDAIGVVGSWRELAKLSGIGERTARRIAGILDGKDLLIVKPRGLITGQASNRFELLYPEAARRLPGFREKFPRRRRPGRAIAFLFASFATWIVRAIPRAIAAARGRAATARGRAATARGRPSAASPLSGDPRHASSNHANNAHAGNGLLKSSTGGWDGGLSPSELEDLGALKQRFAEASRKKSRTGEPWVLGAEQELIGFVAAAIRAVEIGASDQDGRPNDPCRAFTKLVQHKVWRKRGSQGLRESYIEKARAWLRADRGNTDRRADQHSEPAVDSEPSPLGQATAELLGMPSPAAGPSAPRQLSKEQGHAMLDEFERRQSGGN